MLLVFVKQVVEDLLVEKCDSLKVIARPRLKAHNLIDQPIWLVGQIGDILLSLDLLLDVGGIITDLQFDRIWKKEEMKALASFEHVGENQQLTKWGLVDHLKSQYGLVNEFLGLFLADLVLKVESSSF